VDGPLQRKQINLTNKYSPSPSTPLSTPTSKYHVPPFFPTSPLGFAGVHWTGPRRVDTWLFFPLLFLPLIRRPRRLLSKVDRSPSFSIKKDDWRRRLFEHNPPPQRTRSIKSPGITSASFQPALLPPPTPPPQLEEETLGRSEPTPLPRRSLMMKNSSFKFISLLVFLEYSFPRILSGLYFPPSQ